MSRRISKKERGISVEAYSHADKKRKNNPPVGLVSSQTDKLNGITKYAHDPHIDPYLSWAGKKEGNEVNVRNLSLHIHERIDPLRIVKSFLKEKELNQQPTLFDAFEKKLTLGKAFEFYHHTQDWTNRLIAGDSLLVMNSLLQKEGMAGEVQTIYIDPPYGIKYKSNFQPFTNTNVVKDSDSDDDIPAEPEMIQAFRDAWQLGVHSYLTYLRDRLLLARDLLSNAGSCFVQISDENVHHVREVMEEVFRKENFIALINFRKKTMPLGAKHLEQMHDYLIWYAKDKEKIKYHPLFVETKTEGDFHYKWYLLPDGSYHQMTKEQVGNHKLLPLNARIYLLKSLVASGTNPSGMFDYKFQGRLYKHPLQGYGTTMDGVKSLESQNRLQVEGNRITYRYFADDYPVSKLLANWNDTIGAKDKVYVVQTNEEVIQRCLLMTTDPDDLVLDPTCGGGTTAYVAEQWGRRWITCDTSRVAVALAKQRLMTADFDYYQLAHPAEGITSGFTYRKASHITLGSIANNELTQEETLYDQPVIDKSKLRVAGPFTVEAVPGLRVKPFDGSQQKVTTTGEDIARTGETANQAVWRDELKSSGIRAVGGSVINFSRIEPMAGTKYLHAEGEILDEKGKQKKAVISFGPDYGPLEQRQVEEAINEARSLGEKPELVIFAAFHFDPEASKDIDEMKWPGVSILKAQMSVDLLTSDLRKKRSSNQSYWLIGQPDIEVVKSKGGTYKVRVNGFDYYNPVTGEIDSGDTTRIAMWMLDTNYDEQSILPVQVFFPMKDEKRDWMRLAKTLNGAVNEEVMDSFTGVESLPFKVGEHKKVAVKIIDDRGVESFVIKKLK
ncbi:MAG: site-specific DNA-methyltransferase (adenine-specific) [Parcubacteria group bacterium Gr01-1014_33]|nr:MAG: site-specific DNA-methyltransferase (adenine-specific) [Parcubacteria group bacterium Gr01-1014_33]